MTYILSTGTGSGLSQISATGTFVFTLEDNVVVNTILNANLTNSNFRAFSVIHAETGSLTSYDDFTLNGVSFNIENIIDNTSFDIRASSVNNATGTYTITYKILHS
jgi:hypothetical protein